MFLSFSQFFLIFPTESSFLIVLISNCAPFLLFFASEAPDQAPRELKDGTGPRPAGPPGTDGRTKIALKNLILLNFSLVCLSCSQFSLVLTLFKGRVTLFEKGLTPLSPLFKGPNKPPSLVYTQTERLRLNSVQSSGYTYVSLGNRRKSQEFLGNPRKSQQN